MWRLNKRGVLFFNPPYRSLEKMIPDEAFASAIPLVPLGAASVFTYFSSRVKIPSFFYYATDHSEARIKKLICQYRPWVVALSCNAYNRFSCLMIARIAKEIDPSIIIVFGGVHPTFLDEQVLERYPFVDYVVRGEGEISFYELILTLREGGDLRSVDGISFREGSVFVRTKPRCRLSTLDGLSPLDYDYFLSQWIQNKRIKSRTARIFPVETSRGCPFSCKFCSTVTMWGRKVAYRSADRVMEQIRRIPKQTGRMLLLHDMNFTLNKGYVKELCQAFKNDHMNIPWYCATRLDLVDEDILKTMKKAGCKAVFFGSESLSNKILQRVHKGYTAEHAIANINLAVDVGLKVRLSFILGLPGETEKTLKESMSNCMKIRRGVRAQAVPLLILPGTEVYRQALEEGFDESYWLKDHKEAIPLYEGALPLKVLWKWFKIFNGFSFSMPPTNFPC